MRIAVISASVALGLSSTAFAADPVAAPAPAITAAPATAAAKFTVDTPIEAIVADPAGKAAIDANLPGLTSHAMFDQFKSMSLTQLAPMSGGKITDESLAKLKVALAAIK